MTDKNVDESMTEAEKRVEIQVTWGAVDGIPMLPVNQFLASVGLHAALGEPDGIQLVMGHLAAPLLIGTQEEMQAKLMTMGPLPITPQGRFVMSRGRLGEFIRVLQTLADQYDARVLGDRNG